MLLAFLNSFWFTKYMAGLVGLAFLIVGIWTAISPRSVINFKIGLLKSLGIKMTIAMTPKTLKTFRIIGIVMAVLGFLTFF